MARHLARALARSARGLGDALEGPAAAASFSATGGWQQQWAVTRTAAFGSSAAAEQHAAEDAAAQEQEQQADAGPASSAAAQLPQRQANLPPGTHDFQFKEMVMLWTCGRCDTRSAKAFSKQSYESGLVIVECPGCHARHLIADHLGWFGSKGNVEDFAAERGGMVMRRMVDGTVELTPQEVLGASGSTAADTAAELAGDGGSAAAQQQGAGAAASGSVDAAS